MEIPSVGSIYHHFKDAEKQYEIVGIAFHTETEEPMVVYRPLYVTDHELFVRPLDLFMGTVDKPELGYRGPRFTLVRTAQ